jgi:hypothetical protein
MATLDAQPEAVGPKPISEAQPDEVGSKPITAEEAPKSRHRAFSKVKRELSDEDLNSRGVQMLLLDYLAQAEEEVAMLKSFRDKYHEADKRNGVLEEKLKADVAAEVLSTGTIAIGAAALVYGPSTWSNQPSAAIAVAFGAVLTLVGILAKVIRR